MTNRRLKPAKYALVSPGFLLLVLAFFVPVIYTFSLCLYQKIPGSGLIDTSVVSLSNFIKFFEPFSMAVLWRTFAIAIKATLVSLLIGYPLAMEMTRGSNRKKSALLALVLTPLLTNVTARTLGLMIIFGNSGPINKLIQAMGFEKIKFIGTEIGIIIGLVQVFTPYMVLSIKTILENTNVNLQEAARDMGCSKFQAWRKVILPLSMPGVVTGCLLVFLMCFSSYVTPKLMGGGLVMTMSMYIYQQAINLLDWPFAAAAAIILLVITFTVTTVYNRLTSRVERMNDRSGVFRDDDFNSSWHRFKGKIADFFHDVFVAISKVVRAIKPVDMLWTGWCRLVNRFGGVLVRIVAVLSILFIICPIPIVLICSFSEAKLVYFPPQGYSLKWFLDLPNQTEYIKSFLLSLRVAVAAVAISLTAGTLGAIAITRFKWKFTGILKSIFLSPMMVPAVITGLAWVRFASLLGWSASIQVLIAVHVIATIAYVTRTVLGALVGFEASIEEAARDLGASAWQTFWKVTFPIIRPSVIVAALFAFITSLDETSMSVFVAGGRTITLPVRIFSQLEYGFTPTLTAISSCLIVFAIIILIVIDKLIGLNKFKI
ncbi:MAG: ABC transporter permease subunit [Oscillospiraceae bacterium]|nr:ABC transporter permease subunit [Oscillospiraceae bacterium]